MGVEINVDIDVAEITRIGKFQPERKRPILVKLQTWNKKIEVYQKAKNLKGSEIWINDDYTKKVQEDIKALMPYLKREKLRGHRVFLRYDKLVINDEAYELEQLVNEEWEVQRERKRTISERSPENHEINQQLRKVTKTDRKN